jgi:hypothetical protein
MGERQVEPLADQGGGHLVTVLAAHAWKSNAELIADVARLGYLDGRVLDATYGECAVFWKKWQPADFTGHDAKIDGRDFLHLPYPPESFDAVVFDPPYKLNGTPDPKVDARYGVDIPARAQDRVDLILHGAVRLSRLVRPGGHLLVKCMDQVNSGRMWWQTDMVNNVVCSQLERRFEKVDRFDLLGKHRPQPMDGRTQKHAHGRPSTLLVFRRYR